MKNKLYLASLLAVVLCMLAWTARAELERTPANSGTWEYAEIELDTHFLATPKLNQLGDRGWELIGFVSGCATVSDRPLDCKYRAYLKRAK